MRIKKVNLSESLAKFFHERFMKKYNLVEAEQENKTDPIIFLGMYKTKEFIRALEHENLVVIAWMGGDAKEIERNKQLNKDNIFHVAQSHWIKRDLEMAGLETIDLPVSCVEIEKWKPEPLGDKIYLYTSTSMCYKYGVEHYSKLMDYFGKDKFIVAEHDTYSNIAEIYKKCRFGLRLSPHDGLSETVAELGLMGRLVIHNGSLPNCLPYKDYEDIKKICKILLNCQNDITFVSNKTKNYLPISDDWLKTEYYV